MGQKLENAKNLYLQGIRDGKVREAVTTFTGDRYTQHSTGVADGVEGFVAFFEPFIERCKDRDIEVIRTIEDGQYCFVHVMQILNSGEAKWVTADLFDTDANDKIIEHWDVIQAFEENTASGRSMIDGPTEIEDLDKTEANRELIQNFCQEVLVEGNYKNINKYISDTHFHQHSPGIKDGLDGFNEYVQQLNGQGIEARYVKIHKLICQGNFSAALSEVRLNGEDWCYIDIFRIKDGKIVEHWDVQEKILPKEQWGNSGKF